MWSDEDQAYALALAEYEASLSPYGFPMEDVVSKDADPSNRHGTHYFEAESFVPWDVRAAADHLNTLKDDPYSSIRQVRVRRIVR